MVRDDAGAKSDRDGKSPWEGVPLRPRSLQVVFVRRFIFPSNFHLRVPRKTRAVVRSVLIWRGTGRHSW
jgi:hypothetical protein